MSPDRPVDSDPDEEGEETGEPKDEPVSDDPRENVAKAARHIEEAVWKLGLVYSTAVVLRLALRAQRADQDLEMADCVDHHVVNEVVRVIHRLVRAGRRLGADIENPIETSAREP
jgi:hypothetical protein